MASPLGRPPTQGGFQPGTSGNPGGRPADRELAALARRYTPDALRALVEVCRTAIDNPSARVSAARELFDRGFGRARQTVDVTGLGEAVHLHLYAVQQLDHARAVAAELDAPAIEGTPEDFSDALLPAPMPEEALPLWDAALLAAARDPAEPAPEPEIEPEEPAR